jgi:hypothetical protein
MHMEVSAVLRRYERREAGAHDRQLDSRRVRRRLDLAMQPWLSHTVAQGDVVLANLRRMLDAWAGAGFARSKGQKQLHDAFLAAAVRTIYGSTWEANATRVMLEQGWSEAKLHVMAVTPRRFGKTFSVGMFVAAVLLTVPHTRQCIFSTGRRASRWLLELIHDFVCKIPGGADRVIQYNQETLEIRGDTPDDRRLVSSYPGQAKVRARAAHAQCRTFEPPRGRPHSTRASPLHPSPPRAHAAARRR